jgi:wobble nucleotide-excising tRNase
MITRIARLRGCGIFRDFTWSTDLEEFSRYNLIYGWNGTGKSTLGRLMRSLQQRTPPTAGEITIRLGNADLRGDQFPSATVPIRVFNKEFVAESVFPVGGPTRPIFVLGRENVEAQRRIEELRAERTNAEGTLQSANASKRTAEANLDQFSIGQARTIKELLRSPGQNPYNNFDKTAFRRRADDLIAAGNAEALRLSDVEKGTTEAQMRGTARSALTEVSQSLPNLAELHSRVAALLGQTVVSQAIEALTADAALESWTRQGLTLHQQKGRAECLFCRQQMPEGRLEALEGHFNTAYQRFMEQLTACATLLRSAEQAMSAIRFPDPAALYDELTERYRAALESFEADRTSIRQFIRGLAASIQDKQSKAFVQVNLTLAVPTLNQSSIEGINVILREHNQTSAEFQSRIEAARERLAKHMIAGGVEELGRLKDAVTAADQGMTAATTEVGRLSTEISRLEAELVLHRRPADELNRDLKRYLGHSELQLSVEETGYAITRAGVRAEGLSEGERTAIALLYFLKSLEDRDFDLAHGVVVLDDPVSSLDQNALFAAFGFLRARTQPAGQLFILTHSFLLFRLTREWFSHLKGQDKRKKRIYLLRCDAATGERASVLAPIDPLLTEYESEYQYLFSRMYRMANDAQATNLEAYYMAPSIARRVIETFLAFRIPNAGRDSLWDRMRELGFDEETCSRIYRFVQTHSHRDAAGESDEDLTILAESRSVLNDVLAFMRHGDEAHVTRMVSLLETAASPAEATT